MEVNWAQTVLEGGRTRESVDDDEDEDEDGDEEGGPGKASSSPFGVVVFWGGVCGTKACCCWW